MDGIDIIFIVLIILIIVLTIIALIYTINYESSGFPNGGPVIILGEPDEQTWYENTIKYMFPNGKFIKTNRNRARNGDIVIYSWQTLWDNRKLNTNGYRIFIGGEPFSIDSIEADLIIDTKIQNNKNQNDKIQNNNNFIYLPFYSMTFGERHKYHYNDLIDRKINNENRNKFCIFAYSNCDTNQEGVRFRQQFYDKLSKELHIDAPGKCKHNIDFDIVEWTDNVELFKNYKFVIAIENEFHNGYITEKLINSLLAGAIPIYMGAPDVNLHFNTDSFIHIRDFDTMDDCINRVLEIYYDDNLYNSIQSNSVLLDNNTNFSWLTDGEFFVELRNKIDSVFHNYLPTYDTIPQLNYVPNIEIFDSDTFYYLNLDRSIDRKNNIISQANKLDLNVERVPAVNGLKLTVPFIYSLTKSELGCYISHYSIWNALINSNLNYVTVIEDDITFNPNILSIFDIVEDAPEDWDILYLGYNDKFCKINKKNYIKSNSKLKWSKLRNIGTNMPTAMGYIMNRRASYLLCKNALPPKGRLAVDCFMREYFDVLNAYVCSPKQVIVEHNFDSTIRPHETVPRLKKMYGNKHTF